MPILAKYRSIKLCIFYRHFEWNTQNSSFHERGMLGCKAVLSTTVRTYFNCTSLQANRTMLLCCASACIMHFLTAKVGSFRYMWIGLRCTAYVCHQKRLTLRYRELWYSRYVNNTPVYTCTRQVECSIRFTCTINMWPECNYVCVVSENVVIEIRQSFRLAGKCPRLCRSSFETFRACLLRARN